MSDNKTSSWNIYAVCECGWKTIPAFGKIFFVLERVCPRCGQPKEKLKLKNQRFISTSQLFRPSTWGSGYWETKE